MERELPTVETLTRSMSQDARNNVEVRIENAITNEHGDKVFEHWFTGPCWVMRSIKWVLGYHVIGWEPLGDDAINIRVSSDYEQILADEDATTE